MKRRSGENRILTLPNIVSVTRLACTGFVVQAILDQAWVKAFIVFALISSTDWVDGYLARSLNQRSRLGIMLDPVIDRVLLGATFLSLLSAAPSWLNLLLAVIFVREVAMTVVVIYRRAAGLTNLVVNQSGKRSMFAVCAAIGGFVLYLGTADVAWLVVGVAFYATGVCLSYYSCWQYLAKRQRGYDGAVVTS